MPYILVENKKKLIKTLKKTGDDVIVAKCDVIFSFPKGMYKQKKKELKKHPKRFDYYNVSTFVRRLKFKRSKGS